MQSRENLTSDQSDHHVDYDKTHQLICYMLLPGTFFLFVGMMDIESGLMGRDGKTGHPLNDPACKRIWDTMLGSVAFLLGAGLFTVGAVIAVPAAGIITLPMDLYAHTKKHGFFSKSNNDSSERQKNKAYTFN